ncbi:MAG TPA: VOC family protein [Acidimicrobiia bacterium]|jgi:catechol 2,3-dioxygenase-like lactoylglutathione lyase family enzyme
MGDYRPSHVGLCVRDLERSLRFFCDGLGFDEAEGFELDSDAAPGVDGTPSAVRPRIDLLFLADPDGVRVELMALPSGMSPS